MRTLSSLAHDERIDAGKDAAVPGPEIEVEHGVDLRHIAAGLDVEGVQQEHEVAVDAAEGRVARDARRRSPIMPIAICTISSECGWYMKVPLLLQLELVDEGLARRDVRLGQAADAVHAVGQPLAVPVHGRVLGQPVGDEDADLVALDRLDGRARRLAVVAPQMRLHARRESRARPARRRGGIPSSRRSCATAASSR